MKREITEAEKKAKAKYRKKTPQVTVTFYPTETDLYNHISKQENKSGYIKDLIRKDMKGE